MPTRVVIRLVGCGEDAGRGFRIHGVGIRPDPVVFNAAGQMGRRRTAYDFWPETDLSSSALVGRDVLFDGVACYPWDKLFRFGSEEPIDSGRFTLARVITRAGGRKASA